MNNIKNTWKGIKSILTIKNTSSDLPKCLSSNGSTFTNQVETQTSLIIILHQLLKHTSTYSCKHFSDFLKDKNQNSLFLSPTNNMKYRT